MDLRTEKTKKHIIEAFIELRASKPIEKITIKELSDKAYINKATFYRHYEDIYALSETIEDKLIEDCLNTVTDTKTLLTIEGMYALKESFLSQKDLFNI
ncbi:MAG: TetR/AcrR family transcriptional regulator, partial [Clostridia bacterium]|nr:TetR/AcrR family transcriptional regulator [Clostridia bacterium]